MTVTFPLPWSAFGQLLPVQDVVWRIQRFEQHKTAADGRPYVADLADPRWSVEVTLAWMDFTEAERIQSLIEMHGSSQPFWLHDPRRPTPAMDPSGSIGSGTSPALAGVSGGQVSLKGLPAGYALRIGDRFHAVHAATGKPALYRVEENVAANSSGATGMIQISPPRRMAAAANDPVTFVNPRTLVLIKPDSWQLGKRSGHGREGARFTAVEAF